jgi:predicted O-linked N-acetylglucosamine transferase (SPINDLY family)
MPDPAPEGPNADAASLLQDALRLAREGEEGLAAARFRQALAADPGHFAALCLFGEWTLLRGDPEAAAELLERAVEVNPRSARAHASLGRALRGLQRPEEALSHLGRALVFQPDDAEAMVNRGIVLRELGRAEEALACLDRALALQPGQPEALLNRSAALLDLKRPAEALASCDLALVAQPDLPGAHLNRGNALMDLGQPEEALADYERALAMQPDRVEPLLNQGNALLKLGRAEQALGRYDRLLALRPECADAHYDRGNALKTLNRNEEALAAYGLALAVQPGRTDALVNSAHLLCLCEREAEALACADQALALDPDQPEALLSRGAALLGLDRPLEALVSFERALTLEPGYVDAIMNKGIALYNLERHEEALACAEQALGLSPDHPGCLVSRGTALYRLQRPIEALASFDRALAQVPGNLEGLVNRGMALLELKRPSEALESFDRALALRPDHLDAWMNRGSVLHVLGRHREALDSFDHALSIRPDHAGSQSNKIFVQDFLPELSLENHQMERRRYWEAQAASIPPPAAHPNHRDPDRRLVLGYASADFKHHSAASCFGPVLRRHDRAGVRVVCYSGVRSEDEWTREFRQLADAWRPIAGMTDAAVAEQVRADAVDILIDLSGHTMGNRLLVFARKPAPVQVTAWGNGGGTGVPAVDYLFTDPVLIPDRVRPLFTETCFDLPCCITFEAPPATPDIRALPALTLGRVTFGCLNRFSKVSEAALEVWARILVRVPGSRLLVKDIMLEDPEVRRQILEALARLGIGPERVELRDATSRRDHLDTYNEVDIVLDTFPQNGGIATWEALWMGAPVVSMLGQNPASRISGAILHSLGLGGWVAEREADYEELAVRRAADLDTLAGFRAGIRATILASDAGNPERYTRAVERAYRTLWRRWLAGQDPAR